MVFLRYDPQVARPTEGFVLVRASWSNSGANLRWSGAYARAGLTSVSAKPPPRYRHRR